MDIAQRLLAMGEGGYRAFIQNLIPTLPPERIIGVRIPQLRLMAREMADSLEAKGFLVELPHVYHEENLLHAFLIEREKDFNRMLQLTEAFLPYIDNWAVCDSFSPRLFKRYPGEMIPHIQRWMDDSLPYTQRYGMGLLLSNYLDIYFVEDMLGWVSSIQRDEYYVKMMQAWYFATALTKQYEVTLPYIESDRLDKWTHNKALQKAIESRQISLERKVTLRGLKRK